jgi:hypothetical protein
VGAETSTSEPEDSTRSKTKFGTLLIAQCLIYRVNCFLDLRQSLAPQLIGGGALKAFDDGAAVVDELVAEYG